MFVLLLLYVLKITGDREKTYQGTIDKLADKFRIAEDIEAIKKNI